MDNHHYSARPVAAWLFRPEHKLKDSTIRELDPYSARYCPHPRRIEPASRDLRCSQFLPQMGEINTPHLSDVPDMVLL